MAARMGCHIILKQLIEHKCNLNARTETGETALMLCARANHQECFMELLVAGANLGLVNMAETDEFVTNSNEGVLMDALTVSTAYLKMKALCMNICNELRTDIEIHNQHILPSSLDLPNICASIYSVDLCN